MALPLVIARPLAPALEDCKRLAVLGSQPYASGPAERCHARVRLNRASDRGPEACARGLSPHVVYHRPV
jgi:hypothetical protein